MIADNLNPEFVTEIEVDYFFETQQFFKVEIYDCDDANRINDLKSQ